MNLLCANMPPVMTVQEELREYLVANDIQATSFAARIGTSRSHLSLILSGKRRPSPPVAARMEAETDGRFKAMALLLAPLADADCDTAGAA